MKTRGLGRRSIAALVVALALVAVGCSRQPAAPAAAPAAPAVPAAPAAPAAPKAPAELGDPVPKFKFLISAQPYQPEHYETCTMLSNELKKIGFQVDVVTHPSWGAFTQQVGKPYDWGLGCQGYVPREDRLEPNQMLGTYQSSFADGGPNYAGYNNPEYDKAIMAQRTEIDPAKRKVAALKAQEIMAKDVPFIAMYHPSLTHVYNKARYGETVAIPGVGLWNVSNFIDAKPLGTDNVYRVAYVGDMNNLNPANPIASFDLDVIRLVYEPLAKFNPDGSIGPWLAEKWESVSPTSIKVTIRNGHKFHDGRPVTAKDVAFSYNYLVKWKPSWYRTTITPIKGVDVIDDRTVMVNLNQPFGPLPLTFAWIPILPESQWADIVEKQGVKSPAELKEIPRIGSGPYKWGTQTAQTLRLIRNDQHFHPPKSSEFIWTSFGNRESHFLSLVNQSNYFHEQKGMTIAQVDEAKKYPHLGVLKEPSITVYWLALNMRDNSPFKDFTLRQTAAHLLDYEAYVRDVLKGEGDPGQGMMAPANKFWHNFDIVPKETPGKPHYHQYDPAKAKKILQDAGFGWKDNVLYYPKGYKVKPLPASDAEAWK